MGIGQLETTRLGNNLPIFSLPCSPEDKTPTLLYGVRGAKGPPNWLLGKWMAQAQWRIHQLPSLCVCGLEKIQSGWGCIELL